MHERKANTNNESFERWINERLDLWWAYVRAYELTVETEAFIIMEAVFAGILPFRDENLKYSFRSDVRS